MLFVACFIFSLFSVSGLLTHFLNSVMINPASTINQHSSIRLLHSVDRTLPLHLSFHPISSGWLGFSHLQTEEYNVCKMHSINE